MQKLYKNCNKIKVEIETVTRTKSNFCKLYKNYNQNKFHNYNMITGTVQYSEVRLSLRGIVAK